MTPRRPRAAGSSAIALAAALAAASCQAAGVAGPASIEASRSAYNDAIQHTAKEQLLLNIVRLRYRDVPLFLEVASVTSSLSVAASASAATTLRSGESTPLSLGTGIAVSEDPSVTYTLLQGDRFSRQLLSPIELGTLVLLYHSGWSIERVFRVCVQELGGIPNAPSASGPTPDLPPVYERFRRVAELLRALQRDRVLDLRLDERGGVHLRIAEGAAERDEWRELAVHLGFDAAARSLELGREREGGPGPGITTRSLLGCLFFVSQSVAALPHDEERGFVTVTRSQDGGPFDWSLVAGDLMRIRASAERPVDAFVAVRYRRAWYWIDDADLASKSTFSMLAQLFALQAGGVPAQVPVLTIPVGG